MTITLSALQKQRRDTAANWTAENPTLLAGELGLESDTGYWKVGDGSSAWTSLAYVSGLGGEIPVSRLADGAARQLLQTDAAGTGVEWTSNVDVPGTLDVTSTATFDSIARHPIGSAAAPTLTFTGDTNTGIYSPGADQVAVATNGTGRLFVDASGNVGVGAAPSNTFDVTAATNPVASIRSTTAATSTSILKLEGYRTSGDTGRLGEISVINTRDGDEQASIEITADGDTEGKFTFKSSTNSLCEFGNSFTRFFSSNTERLRITSAGLVGIGTSAPNRTLHVYGDQAFSNSNNTGTLLFAPATSANYIYSRAADNSITAVPLGIAMGSTDAVRIDTSGRVGIGTTSPGAKLQVSETSGTGAIFLADFTASAASQNPLLRIIHRNAANTTTSSVDLYKVYQSGFIIINNDTDASNFTSFTVGASERLRITSAGKVGIGTSSPGSNLEIVGGTTTAGPGAELRLSSADQTIAAADEIIGSVTFKNNDASGGMTGYMAKIDAASNRLFDGDPASGMNLRFFAGTAADGVNTPPERMRLTSAGRLGIGTTTVDERLHVSGGNIKQQLAAATNGGFNINNGTNDLIAIGTGGFAANGGSVTDGGIRTTNSLVFATGSGAPERARIDSSGRLLIGTSTARTVEWSYGDAGTPKLQVEGDGGASSQVLITDTRSDGRNPSLAFAKTRNGAIVTSGDVLGSLSFFGDDGVDTRTWGGRITCEVDGTPGANDMPGRLVFSTTADGASSPTERMRIGSNGAVLLHTTSATINSTNFGTNFRADDRLLHARDINGAGAVAQIFGNAGELRILGDGNLENTNNSYGAISDVRLKENIIAAGSQWDDLKALQVRNYNFKPETGYNTHTQIGLVAQEVELVSPGLVGESIDEETGESTKSVNYSVLYMKAVKALQEAMERIETLEGMVAVNNITIDEQQHQLSTLAARLTALESA